MIVFITVAKIFSTDDTVVRLQNKLETSIWFNFPDKHGFQSYIYNQPFYNKLMKRKLSSIYV